MKFAKDSTMKSEEKQNTNMVCLGKSSWRFKGKKKEKNLRVIINDKLKSPKQSVAAAQIGNDFICKNKRNHVDPLYLAR